MDNNTCNKRQVSATNLTLVDGGMLHAVGPVGPHASSLRLAVLLGGVFARVRERGVAMVTCLLLLLLLLLWA